MEEQSVQVGAPIPGRIVSLRQVPDLVFSGMIVGGGSSLAPAAGIERSNCSSSHFGALS